MKVSEKIGKNSLLMICLPVVYIVVGALLLFAEGMNTQVFAYIFGAGIIVGGAVNVIRYFVDKSYLDYSSYGFSTGIFAIILGVIAMIRVEVIATSITVCIGIAIMITAIVKLQNAIQLLTMKNKMWIPVLSVAVVFIVIASLILINLNGEEKWVKFTYVMLFIDGIVGLAINIFMYFSLGKHKKTVENPLPPVENK